MMQKLTYEFIEGRRTWKIKVRLEGKEVGAIKPDTGNFRYFPKGNKQGGELYKTVDEVKRSIEGKDREPHETA